MPGAIPIHREVPLNDAKISKETTDILYEMLQKNEVIISKGDNDICQTDLIQMHIATKLNATPIVAWPSPLKIMMFLEQEIKISLDVGIIRKSMSTWAHPIVVVKKYMPEGAPQQIHICISYRKVNSLLPAVTPAGGNKKGVQCTDVTAQIQWTPSPIKRSKVFHHTGPLKWLLPHKIGWGIHPQSAFTTVFGKFEFPWLLFSLSQGQDFFIHLIYDIFGLNKVTTQCWTMPSNDYSQHNSKSN